MARVINFNPGPSAIPLPVLEKAQSELLDFQGSGMSIMEHSHRGKVYEAVHERTKALLKELLAIPDSHEVLFMQGGASAQFALLPMNFLGEGQNADYVNTGAWSKKALAEANIVATGREAASSADKKFSYIPPRDSWSIDDGARYLHITSNNTIFGTQFAETPDAGGKPLVADMSSDIASRPLPIDKYALIYAGAQKNLGPSGVTIVIANRDFLAEGRTDIPSIFRYSTILEGNSLQNTIPTFGVYLVGEVLSWLKAEGGVAAMEKRNTAKTNALYEAIDGSSGFYSCPVERSSRSRMNVVFRLPSEELEGKFVSEATAAGMIGTKGHRSVGGIRISTYNAVTPKDIDTLVSFMADFAKKNG
ncbi:MAG: 3-phosphoserine/phosphohydroxythreonine transaminase [Myxococcales bacterium]|nr:3-phosphoserine/phosphohydroxythreonine transaminase [Myxococcales bacterium]